jgi:predicted RNA binding protein YcfA (HicA-like mRNA interferase family)
MPRGLYNWNFANIQKFLKSHGFVHHSTKGSHFHYKKVTPERSYLVIVAYHGTKIIPRGTMNSIIRQSGIDKKNWENN